MLTEDIRIQGSDGSFGASLHLPESVPAPAVLLAHEIFGVNAFMEHTARWLASKGFVVLCPDMFWRQGAGMSLNPSDDNDMQRALALWKSFDLPIGVADLNAAARFLAQQPYCNGKLSVVGYCLGGALAVLMASQSAIHKCVGYYGVGLEHMGTQVAAVTKPLLMHMPGSDHLVTPEARKAISATMAQNKLIDLFWYEEEGHAFARMGGKNYSPEAADMANRRTLEFLTDPS